MKTIKIILNDDGSVLSLSCGFQLNQYSYNDTLLNVYVPSNILENQTDLENVDYSNNVVMGMYYTLANGSQKVGNPYYFTFVKDNVVIDNKLYTLYERKMPKEFTLYYGTQTYSINVVALKTTINNGVATNEVIGNITSNNFELNIVRSMNMVDDGIEEDTDLSTLIANVNSLLANMLLKQDKSDVLIQVSIANGSNVKTSVVREALNNLNQRVAENYTNVTTNTGDITQLKQDVIDINNQLLTSFRYCGSYTSPNPPTNPNLNQLMTTWGLTARNGDVIIWTWTKSSATDVSYTCRYNVNNTWDTIEIPTVESASNNEAGLIQGNYGNDTTSNILASIVGGKIVDIYFKKGNTYYELTDKLGTILNELDQILVYGTASVVKSQYATYDMSEYGSNNPTPINDKYMTKSEGATKQFVTDYALPKTFNDIYRFDFTNNKLVSSSVNTSKTLATQLGSVDFGSYTIEKSDVLTFELSSKNTFACNFYAMFDNNIDDVTFTIIIKANNTPIASTTSETIDFTGGTYKKISINGDFALLGDSEITIDDSVTLSVELSANITTSATNNLTIYSNTTLPSAFTLNVASTTIVINSSGVLGGVNYHSLSGVKTNNEIDFALPSNTTLVDETIHTFILNYSGITTATNTTLYITNGNVRCNINLPSNYNSGSTLTFENVSQFLAPNNIIVFTAIYKNGFFEIIGGNTSEFEPYVVQLSDITITGTSSPYPITMSSALETAVLSGKRALFVSGTIMNTLTSGEITTDTLFNVISFDKETMTGMKHVIAFSTMTTLIGAITSYSIGLAQDENDQWYALYTTGSIDPDSIYLQLNDLDTRVSALENAGGGKYYHKISVLTTNYIGYIIFAIINDSATPFDATSLGTWLSYNGHTNINNGYLIDSTIYSSTQEPIKLKRIFYYSSGQTVRVGGDNISTNSTAYSNIQVYEDYVIQL